MQNLSIKFTAIFIFFMAAFGCHAQNPVNWTEKQLMEPAVLAKAIDSSKELPVIISVGPAATIPGSLAIGMTNSAEGVKKLKAQLTNLPKDKKIVIYCGCCPFEHCPNVRPAIDALKEMKFTNYYLLNIPHNIKKDWIDQGYPVSKD
jgi:thiosulfate/3-mercaptopyruvate sulfurtransferase